MRHFVLFMLVGVLSMMFLISPEAVLDNRSVEDDAFPSFVAQADAAGSGSLIIYAFYPDTYISYEPDEAVAVMNIGDTTIDLDGWQITDGEGTVTFPSYTLAPGERVWATGTATTFEQEWGFAADFEYDGNSDAAVPDMTGSAPAFGNSGDEVQLLDASSTIIDALVYESGDTTITAWSGDALHPYTQGYFGEEGQVLYRKLDQATGLPVADTNTASDWAQATDDDINGKKVRYPGWDLDRYFFPHTATEQARLEYAVAPDASYAAYSDGIDDATSSLYIEGYSLDNAHVVDILVDRLNAGVTVTVLLEEEIVNGISDQEKWACEQIETAGGQCWFMYNDDGDDVHDRYTFQHAKFTVVDEELLLTGSENIKYSSMPADDKSDGTKGNRGVYLITDAPSLVNHALDVFEHDLDPVHNDIRRWDPSTDSPPSGFTPDYSSGGTFYSAPFTQTLVLTDTFDFEVIQAPENVLRSNDSLLGMVNRAGTGGKVFVEQLYERKYWGPSSSNPADDPNPRLEAYIDAGRRGATVRILLDSFYNDPTDSRSNTATCDYVNTIASNESLDLECLLGNPTGNGIHNKLVMVWDGSQGWVHTGSINGSENSSKNNRELAVQVQSTPVYEYLLEVFDYDWTTSGGSSVLPSADVQITFIEYNPPGNDVEGEYVQIENKGSASADMTGWTLEDAANHTYTFPSFTLGAGNTVQVWTKSGTDDATNLYWGSGSAIWNNGGDCADVDDDQAQLVDQYCY